MIVWEVAERHPVATWYSNSDHCRNCVPHFLYKQDTCMYALHRALQWKNQLDCRNLYMSDLLSFTSFLPPKILCYIHRTLFIVFPFTNFCPKEALAVFKRPHNYQIYLQYITYSWLKNVLGIYRESTRVHDISGNWAPMSIHCWKYLLENLNGSLKWPMREFLFGWTSLIYGPMHDSTING